MRYNTGKEGIAMQIVFEPEHFLSAAYARNNSLAMDKKYKKSYQIGLDYKGAEAMDKGSWGAYVAYRYLGGASIAPTTDGAMAGTKGIELGTAYTVWKNVIVSAKYFTGKTIYADPLGDKRQQLFGRVEFLF